MTPGTTKRLLLGTAICGVIGCLALQFAAPSESAAAAPPPVAQSLPGAPTTPGTALAVPANIKTFINNHCIDCHEGSSAKGDLDLSNLRMDPADAVSLHRWTRVLDRVHEGEMPPKRKARPTAADQTAFLGSLSRTLYDADLARHTKLGRTLGRRLTRLEFENSLADVLGVHIPLQDELPEDPFSYVFDTVAASQDVSPQLLERYHAAVDLALDAAFAHAARPDDKRWAIHLLPKDFARTKAGVNERHPIPRGKDDALVFSTNMQFHGRIPATRVPRDGWYRIRISATGVNPPPGGIVWCTLQKGMCQSSDPTLRMIGTVGAGPQPQEFVFETWMEENHMLELRPNDGNVRKASYGNVVDAGKGEQEGVAAIAIRSIAMEQINRDATPEQARRNLFGDLAVTGGNKQAATPVSKSPQTDLPRLLKAFAGKAFRRPITDAELKPYVDVARAPLTGGGAFGDALRTGYRAILCSPRFLYLVEEPGVLRDHALASRLSYFLWSAPPDATLRAVADAGRLREPAQLRAQVERMLNDRRSRAFVVNFTDQWLKLREIDATQPDPRLYPEFDAILQDSMVEETRGFFAELLKRDLSVSNFVDSDFAMLDNRLAVHYGLPPTLVGPGGVRPVPLKPQWHRGGLLGQASILKVTANGTTTSPILRGIWVLERLLGQHVPPPPPNVPAVEPDIRGASTIRDQLDKHRASEACASCHVKIDPPGFALESYDVIGGWRDNYRVIARNGRKSNDGPVVDASYTTAKGEPFKDVAAYKQLLLRDKEMIARCVAQKLLVYGTGATISYADRKTIDQIVAQTKGNNYGMRSIVYAVVASPAFGRK